MYRNPAYHKVKISEDTYLVPIGQSRADLMASLLINETVEFLWDSLDQELSLKELLALAEAHYGINDSTMDTATQTEVLATQAEILATQTEVLATQAEVLTLREDITAVIQDLLFRGLLLEEPNMQAHTDQDYCKTLSIAGLKLNLYGPAEAYSPDFDAFQSDYTGSPDQNVQVCYGMPAARENGSILIRNSELTVMELDSKYILLFHAIPRVDKSYNNTDSKTTHRTPSTVRELHLKKDGSQAILYCIPNAATLAEDVLHAMRFAYLLLASKYNLFAIHSASVCYNGKAFLFSAPSGTGKSTHAALWQTYAQAELLNGDLNLLGLDSQTGKPVVYGLPWCGTSGIATTETHELGGIIFLAQAPTDSIEELPFTKQVLALTNRLISPVWDNKQMENQLTFAKELLPKIFTCKLHCTKKKSAFDVIHKAIERC